MRCSNYIWVFNNSIAYQGDTDIRGLMVIDVVMQNEWQSDHGQLEIFLCTILDQ